MRCRSPFYVSQSPKGTKKGLSLVELVLALGLIFISAGGVMSVIVAGVAQPKRNQFAHERDSLAKARIDELMGGAAAPLPVGYTTFTSNPRYEYAVDVAAAPFDPTATIIAVSVRGPKPQQMTNSIHGVFLAPSGSVAFTQHGCNACHTLGPGPSGLGPNLGISSLTGSATARGSADVDAYISESIRNPTIWYNPDPTVYTGVSAMSVPAGITGMSPADLSAIAQYIKSFP